MEYKINILGKDRPVKLKMFAAREYKKLTGFNIMSPTHSLTDIFGDGKEKDTNPELVGPLIYACLRNGDPAFMNTLQEVESDITIHNLTEIVIEITRLYLEEMTGQEVDPVALAAELAKQEKEKNLPAPATNSGA